MHSRVNALFSNASDTDFYTLAGVGFKAESHAKVVNFTEQMGNKVAFKDSEALGEQREDADFYVKAFQRQLATRPIKCWTSTVADNASYMRSAHLGFNVPHVTGLWLCGSSSTGFVV